LLLLRVGIYAKLYPMTLNFRTFIAFLFISANLILVLRMVVPVVNYGLNYADYVSVCRSRHHHAPSCSGRCELILQLNRIAGNNQHSAQQIAPFPTQNIDLFIAGYSYIKIELSGNSIHYFPEKEKLQAIPLFPAVPPPVS
jgi:hypothetical protein